jgi:two-component system sensor histidine kinase CpxA
MKFPLLAKVLGWLMLHLLVLSLAFAGFVAWQFRLGLDSLLSGAAGDHLRSFGEGLAVELTQSPESAWPRILQEAGKQRGLQVGLHDFNRFPPTADLASGPPPIPSPRPQGPLMRNIPIPPPNVDQRIRGIVPQPLSNLPHGRPQHPPGPPPADDWDEDRPPDSEFTGLPNDPPPPEQLPRRAATESNARSSISVVRPVFLLRGDHGDGYWAGVDLPVRVGREPQPRRFLLLIRSDSLDGRGMFFDLKPWLWGGLAVLCLSLLCWTPFVAGITRYIGHLTRATDQIAAGRFDVSVHHRRGDELGRLGGAIRSMAGRLDLLVRGQKRFLGDVAHELCSPLARIRTGLSVLETRIPDVERKRLEEIEADAAELASLVEELLAFSRSSNRPTRLEPCDPSTLIREVLAREGGGLSVSVEIPEGLLVRADARMFARAFGNLIRNARMHAGPHAAVTVTAQVDTHAETVHLTVADNGSGVPEAEVARIFEPFYRPDRSRSRETGGSGLGLAIVKSCIEACGGTVNAENMPGGGFSVTLEFLLEQVTAGQLLHN